MATLVTKSISADDTFTDVTTHEGYFNLSISGTFSATVTVQRSYDGSTWHDVDSWTSPAEEIGFEPESLYYRVGIKSGNYSSGTAVVRLGHEDRENH